MIVYVLHFVHLSHFSRNTTIKQQPLRTVKTVQAVVKSVPRQQTTMANSPPAAHQPMNLSRPSSTVSRAPTPSPVPSPSTTRMSASQVSSFSKENFAPISPPRRVAAEKISTSVSVESFLFFKASTIAKLLQSGIVNYRDMKLPKNCFDFMYGRSRHIVAYFNMLKAYKIDGSALEKEIERHVMLNYSDYINKECQVEQVRNLSRHLMCLYLNHINCPRDFWMCFPDSWQ